jgi:hypothetical protein
MQESETLTPGSIHIRPTRVAAERQPQNFYSLLDTLRDPGTFPLRKIAELSGDTSLNPEPNTLRKIQNRTLPDDARRSVLRYIFEDGGLLTGGFRKSLANLDDAFYFSFLNQFNIRDAEQDEARAHVIGSYRYWGHSADHEGEFVLCRLDCFEDAATRALKARLHFRKTQTGSATAVRLFDGYIFCVQNMYLMAMRREASDEVRLTVYPRTLMSVVGTDVNPRSVFAGQQNHVTYMDGITFGIGPRNCFLSPVHVALVDEVDELAKLDASLDIMPEGDARVPERVIKRLRDHGPLRWL